MRLSSLPLHAATLAVSLVFLTNSALAQKKPKKAEKTDGPSAAATWTDPTESEKSDKGPYAPHKEESDQPAPAPHKNAPDKGRSRDKIQVFAQAVIGFGRVPLNQPSYEPGDKGLALGFLLGGRLDASKELSFGLRIPITTGTIKNQTTGTSLSSTVFGAPELFGEYRLSLSRLTTLPIGLGVGVPVAQGNPDRTARSDTAGLQKGYVQGLADATSGWRDSELYTPKHLPIIVSGGVHHERHDWELHGDLKFVVLPALSTKVSIPESGGATYPGSYKLNALALREVTTLGGSYNFLSSPLIYAALDLALVWTPLQTFVWNPTPANTTPSTMQAVLEPRIGARFGLVSPSVSYIAPLGGRLGEAKDGGIRFNVSAYF